MSAQPEHSGHSMIALYPPPALAKALAIDDGLNPADLHLTLAYTGKADHVDISALNAVAEALADRGPITATIAGHARLTGSEDADIVVALVDSPDLDQLRRDAEAALAEHGLHVASEHGYLAHISLIYLYRDTASPVQRIAPITFVFDRISAVHGTDRSDYELTGGLADDAAEAYLTGYALSGGPATPQLDQRCTTAVTAALEHSDDPRVLEALLEVGHIDGTWASVHQRRDDLIREHVAKVETAWRAAVKHISVPRMVKSFRRLTGMLTEDAWTDEVRAQAKMLAAGMLAAIRYSPEHEQLTLAIEVAIAAATAEGKTGALAVAAAEAGHTGFDWDTAFAHMYEPLTHLEDLPGMADPWVEALIAGNAADIGRTLASLAANGGTYDEMVSAVEALTSGDSIRAVTTLIDYAMSGSANAGALALYASEGVEAYDVMTAGDGRVCPFCEQAQEDNPHDLAPGAEPIVPAHPLCRCAVAAAMKALPFSAFSMFLKAVA
jgi:2'-5' RNA ligase